MKSKLEATRSTGRSRALTTCTSHTPSIKTALADAPSNADKITDFAIGIFHPDLYLIHLAFVKVTG